MPYDRVLGDSHQDRMCTDQKTLHSVLMKFCRCSSSLVLRELTQKQIKYERAVFTINNGPKPIIVFGF
jgi:hypothetical protein